MYISWIILGILVLALTYYAFRKARRVPGTSWKHVFPTHRPVPVKRRFSKDKTQEQTAIRPCRTALYKSALCTSLSMKEPLFGALRWAAAARISSTALLGSAAFIGPALVAAGLAALGLRETLSLKPGLLVVRELELCFTELTNHDLIHVLPSL